MWSNSASLTTYIPSQPVYEFNIADGLCYPCDGGAVLGANTFQPGRLSITPYLADQLIIAGKAQRILLVNICVNGTSAQDWCPIGQCYPRITHVLNQLNTLGITPNYCVMLQGQADVAIQNSQANYTNLRTWGMTAMAQAGLSANIINGIGVHWTNVSNVYPTITAGIRAGQLQAAINAGVSAGADDDVYGDTHRVEGVHWNDLGRYYTTQSWLPAFPVF